MSFSPKTSLPIAYLILFIAIALVLVIISNTLDKIINSIALGGLNTLLGGLFGALKYALIVSVLLNVLDAIDSSFPIIKSKSKTESIAYKPLIKLAPTLWEEGKKSKVFDVKDTVNDETQPTQRYE